MKQITTYSNGFKVKLHNKRILCEKKETFKVRFSRLMDKNEKSVQTSHSQWQEGRICYTEIELSEEAANGLLAGFLSYYQEKGINTI